MIGSNYVTVTLVTWNGAEVRSYALCTNVHTSAWNTYILSTHSFSQAFGPVHKYHAIPLFVMELNTFSKKILQEV